MVLSARAFSAMDITDKRMEVDDSRSIPDSPYLTAIQSLQGQSPGEKYQHLNTLIGEIVETCRATAADPVSVMESQGIPSAMIPLVRILVGDALRSTEAVLDALKSPELAVVNKALRAKWFFDGASAHVHVDYFAANVLPFVSVRTRLQLVKQLSRGLAGAEEKAEKFFDAFCRMYNPEQALPFLPYCGSTFAYDAILQHKINLPLKILETIFERHPMFAIRYLHLGNRDNKDNKDDRAIHSISLSPYKSFLPKLIKHHTLDYFQLVNCHSNNHIGKINLHIGRTRTSYLFKNCADVMIEQAGACVQSWPLKSIYSNLTRKQFEKLYYKLFPHSAYDFDFYKMLDYLKYYPKDDRLNLMINKYKLKYKSNMLEELNSRKALLIRSVSSDSDKRNFSDLLTTQQFEMVYLSILPNNKEDYNLDAMLNFLKYYPKTNQINLLKMCYLTKYNKDLLSEDIEKLKSEELLRLLPDDKRVVLALKIISKYNEKTKSDYYKWICYIPIKESLEIFKKVSKNTSNSLLRFEFMKKMIYSCKVFNSQECLLQVLVHYNSRYKNERSSMLYKVLEYFTEQFSIESLDKLNWLIFFKILQRAYVKNEFFGAPKHLIERIFDGSMHRLLMQLKEEIMDGDTENFLDRIINMYLEYTIEVNDNTQWDILNSLTELQLECIEKLLHKIPQKYPDDHPIWQKEDKMIKVITKIIVKLRNYNNKIKQNAKSGELNDDEINKKITKIRNYTWLMKSTIDILIANENDKKPPQSFKELVNEYDPEFYSSIVTEITQSRYDQDIKSGKAWLLLKSNPEQIFAHWDQYLSACRQFLRSISQKGARAARKFVLSIKWCNDLPMKFIERCLLEINQSGSLIILGLLLEGEVLSKILSQYIPTEGSVDIYKSNAKEQYEIVSSVPSAMNVTIPPVSFELLMSLFQDEYVKLAVRSVTNFGHRVEKPKVMMFTRQLADKPVSVKKHAIRLAFQIATTDELLEFLTEFSTKQQHQSITVLIARKVLKRFIRLPNDKTWALVEICIAGLRIKDTAALKVFCNVKSVSNVYAPLYIMKLLDKVEELAEKDNLKLETKEKWISTIVKNITIDTIPFLRKEIVVDILRRYYFRAETRFISYSTQTFAAKFFSRPFRHITVQ